MDGASQRPERSEPGATPSSRLAWYARGVAVHVIGLTGGIASGKSTVARMLAERGAAIVDADLLARQVVEPGQPALAELVARFGPSILRPEGTQEAGLDVHQDARMYVARLDEGASVAHTLANEHVGYLYLIQGRLDANGKAMQSGDAAYVRSNGELTLAARGTSELILVDTIK